MPFRNSEKTDQAFPRQVQQALEAVFATGVTVITVDYEGEVHGMTANAFTSVSLDPQLILVCVDHRAKTHAHLHARKRFGINILAADQRRISEYYANPNRTHDEAEQVAGARFDRTQHGTPVLHGALAYLECKLQTAQDAGDHTIFIAEVEGAIIPGNLHSLTASTVALPDPGKVRRNPSSSPTKKIPGRAKQTKKAPKRALALGLSSSETTPRLLPSR